MYFSVFIRLNLKWNTTFFYFLAAAGRKVIAFYASISGGEPVYLGDNQTVVYGNVKFNHGDCYNKVSGHFTCPVKGLYHFNTSAFCVGQANLHLGLCKNAKQITLMYAHGHGNSASVSLPLELDKGDNVYVKHSDKNRQGIHNGDFTNFSGNLVYEIWKCKWTLFSYNYML